MDYMYDVPFTIRNYSAIFTANNLVNRAVEALLKSFAGIFLLFRWFKSKFEFTKDLIIDFFFI